MQTMARASVILLIFRTLVVLPMSLAQVYKDPSATVEQRVEDLLPRLTLQEKISQMIQDASNSIDRMPGIGSYLIGASDPPDGNTPPIWRQHMNELQAASSNQRLGIPIIVATDAVHGQNIVKGGTIFPHNIGLGMTRNPALLKEIAQVTADEMVSTGLDQTFGPMIAVARTQSWGRTYESYSESTDIVRSYVSSFIEGLQGTATPWKVVATAKHWIGDGGTTYGDDAGDTMLTFQELMDIHGAPFLDAIQADVGVVMVSFSSVNGVKMHQNQQLVENVLKGSLGFQGFVLSDWLGHSTIPGSYDTQIRLAVNAGIDMLMCPYQAYGCYGSILNSVNRNLIPESRIDDAVRRILRVKFKAGLFEKKLALIDPNVFQPIGSRANRDVARQAVRESLVLLKNSNNLLPLDKTTRVFLAGKNADNIQNQCGGWTMSWQGTSSEPRHAIVGGKTIRDGFDQLGSGPVTFSENGTGIDPSQHDVAIVVVGETPYAEGAGDDLDLSLDSFDRTTINNVRSSGLPMVLIVISGRPMVISNELGNSDAAVAAWLPGTEGDGVAEVLIGDYDFSGKLSFSWPANMGQVLSGFVGEEAGVQFPLGYGLTFQDDGGPPTGPANPPSVPVNPRASPPVSNAASACSAHPNCSHLGGSCCPTVAGINLECCDSETRPQPPALEKSGEDVAPPAPPSASCASHPACAHLADDCCPPKGSNMNLACCGEGQAPAPPLVPSPVAQPPVPAPVTNQKQNSCAAHPQCSHLSGNCCPTADGTRLACCEATSAATTSAWVVAENYEPDISSGGSTSASTTCIQLWCVAVLLWTLALYV